MDGKFVKEDFWFFIVHYNKLATLLCYPRKNPNREGEFRTLNFQQGQLNVFESRGGGGKMFNY